MTERIFKQRIGPIRVRRKITEQNNKIVSTYDFKYLKEELDFAGINGDKIKIKDDLTIPLSAIFPLKSNSQWITWPVLVSLVFRFATGPKADALREHLCPEPPQPEKNSFTKSVKPLILSTGGKKNAVSDIGYEASPRVQPLATPMTPTSTYTTPMSARPKTPPRNSGSSDNRIQPVSEKFLVTEKKLPDTSLKSVSSDNFSDRVPSGWEKPAVDKGRSLDVSRSKNFPSRQRSWVKEDNNESDSNNSNNNKGLTKASNNKQLVNIVINENDQKAKKEPETKKATASLKRQLSRTPSMKQEQPGIALRVDRKKALTKVQAQAKAKEKKQTKQRKKTQLRREGTLKLMDITNREKKMEAIFKKLDKNNIGYIEIETLQEALSKWGVELSPNNLSLLVNYFGFHKNLNFQNFQEFLMFYTELRKCFEEGGNGVTVTRAKLAQVLAGFKYKFSDDVVKKLSDYFSKGGSNAIVFQEYFTLIVQIKNLDKQLQEYNTSRKQVFLEAPQFQTLLRAFGIYISVLELQLFLGGVSDKTKLCFIKFEDLVNLIVQLKDRRDEIQILSANFRAEERAKVLRDQIASQNFRISRTKRVAIGTMSFGQKREKIRKTMMVKLDEALVAVEQQFQAIINDCTKKKIKYSDPVFPAKIESLCPQNCPQYEFYRNTVTCWKRPSELSNYAKLFLDSIDEGDLSEGALKDTWYLSAIAVLAANGNEAGTVKDLFVFMDDKIGIYVCRFWLNGKWNYVIVDDQIPCNDQKQPAFAKCRSSNEFWISILEKAYAKFYGSYYIISRDGNISDALVDFTGEASEIIPIKDNDVFWRTLVSHFKKSFLLAAVAEPRGKLSESSSEHLYENSLEEIGIQASNAYTILECQEYEGTRLIRLRNAWGKPDWKGRWSNGSEEWNPTLMDHFSVEFLPGIFFMSFEDFTEYFSTLYVLRLPSMDEYGMLWKKYELNGEWKAGETCGGSFNFPTWSKNPQYQISLSRDTELFISLRQSDKRSKLVEKNSLSDVYAPIGFFIVKKKEASDFRVSALEADGSDLELITTYDNVRENSSEFFAEKNNTCVIVPSTFLADIPTEFNLTIFSNFPIEVKQLSEPEIEYATVSGVWDETSSGGSVDHVTWRKNPQYHLHLSQPGTFSVVLEQNNNPLHHIGTHIWQVEKDATPKWKISNSTALYVPSYSDSPSVKFSHNFPAGDYIIMCATFSPQEFGKFSLKILGKKEDQKQRKISLTPLVNNWKVTTVEGEWNEENCGGCSNYETHYDNPKFYLQVPFGYIGSLTIIIQQESPQNPQNSQNPQNLQLQNSPLPHIGFYLFTGENANEQALVGVSEYVNTIEVSQNFQMEEETHGTYTLMPTTYHPISIRNYFQKFRILIYSVHMECPLSC